MVVAQREDLLYAWRMKTSLPAGADRLDLLAAHQTADASDLRRAAEAARILAYLAAARGSIWPGGMLATSTSVASRSGMTREVG